MNIHIKTAFSYIRRAPFQAMAAISVLALTFFVATIISILVYSSERLLIYFETRPQIIGFLKTEATDQAITGLKNKLSSDSRIHNVSFVSKEVALEIYKKATSDNPLLGELVSPSIFPASLEFSVTNLSYAKEVIDELKKEEIVESVGFTASIGGEDALGDIIERLKNITFYIRTVGIGFVAFLGLTSFLVLLVVIGMRITTRREEIEILELIGATPGFIKMPIILEAIIYAFLGSLFGWLLGVIVILYSAPTIISYLKEIPIFPQDVESLSALLGIILLGELLAGVTIALPGSLIAIGRARRKR